MYVRWQALKRQRPERGDYQGMVCDEAGEPVRSERGNILLGYKRPDGTVGQDVRWNAVLVESVRVDGKPRQRHIANLGGITESRKASAHQRRYFWDGVHERLDQLSNRISIEDRRRIEEAVALKVPRLTREEHDASVETCRPTFTDYEHPPYREPA